MEGGQVKDPLKQAIEQLTDLRHWCVKNDVDWSKVVQLSYVLYLQEKARVPEKAE